MCVQMDEGIDRGLNGWGVDEWVGRRMDGKGGRLHACWIIGWVEE